MNDTAMKLTDFSDCLWRGIDNDKSVCLPKRNEAGDAMMPCVPGDHCGYEPKLNIRRVNRDTIHC